MDIEHHSSGSIGHVGHVHLAACESPEQVAVHCPEKQSPFSGKLPCIRHIVQNPLELGPGEIGVGQQSGAATYELVITLLRKSAAILRSPAVLPYDCIIDRLAGFRIPDKSGFPLVGNPDRSNVLSPDLPHNLLHYIALGLPQFFGIVLHPSVLGEMLGEFLLANGNLV